jgi:phage tail sheath protein FI
VIAWRTRLHLVQEVVVPASLSYPGVYLQEAPGVRTITGVSTSVAAFLGTTKRGPLNRAVPIFSFADFERAFGGLSADSELSYAVRLFFLNGGSQAYVVRVAAGASTASLALDDGGTSKLTLTALDGGLTGNFVKLVLTRNRLDPGNRFDLSVSYAPPDNPAAGVTEQYVGLSMSSRDPNFVETAINGVSTLVAAKRTAGLTFTQGTSQSGPLDDAITTGKLDAQHTTMTVVVDGTPVPVTFTPLAAGSTVASFVTQLTNALTGKATVTTTTDGAGKTHAVITSPTTSDFSSVRVQPGARNDAARLLGFGIANGGTETDGASGAMPAETPGRGSIAGTAVAAFTKNTGSVGISVDGAGPDVVSFDFGTTTPADKLQAAIDQISAAVRARRPTNPGYAGFTATKTAGGVVTFTSGSRGAGSTVIVSKAPANDVSADLGFAPGTPAFAVDTSLRGGAESAVDSTNRYTTFIDTSAPKRAIYALDDVDVFNLLCIPGVSDAAVIVDAAAYATQRDAFYLVDPPRATAPVAMQSLAEGTTLPKADHAALYWPNVYVADPLASGALRLTPPSGAMAGVYARTDAARGIWKAPAGTDASVVGAQALEYNASDGENGILNPSAVNCIRAKPPYGIIAWGARTLNGSDAAGSQYKYVPVRRLASYIKLSLFRGTQWAVFEPNDEPLWSQIRLSIGGFMDTLFRQGAFQGRTARDAYFVKCDSETTTQNDVDRGVVNIIVGFAPLKPAEFVVITLTQIAGQSAT